MTSESVKEKRKPSFAEGDTVVCITSASCGYKVGQEYTLYRNEDGHLCLRGSDGYEDLWSMLVSGFKKNSKTMKTNETLLLTKTK